MDQRPHVPKRHQQGRIYGQVVTVREPLSKDDFERYYALRWKILREPWQQPRESEKDEVEHSAIHLMARLDNVIVGVGRIHFNSAREAQIRYMAVEEQCRGMGIGRELLCGLEIRARELGADMIVLNARANAVVFYERHGYRIKSRASTLFGAVDHWAMGKALL